MGYTVFRLIHADGSAELGLFTPACVYMSVFHTISQKPMQLGSPSLI